ncbi:MULTISPECIES: NAD(P)/FAD-dependent oxidoreductase [Desulfococcus]|uniref:FAD dependent oxidoreductase n=1 Tax=Desulfococcus multivorans DSM 2059 TaxID=1121405 RepID=S7TKS0_DESML|nr:FAD-binding oxidoreductase [Desulfococcus multivorans]AOY58270.1 FAD-dependent oxidoreductase [Desulfococcus multivorans]AQV00613.1 FAD-dependent oxidoreductase [Desulfococcus multivorans]EPR37787.1 FAD dependent oxidoreductase [Desulfococcus multivorans DSM 2059]MDX9818300.1 FAD-binding oxidoreductase [Desulfococcus multivorans]SJZ97898.1 Glycine/D-amino acid oxidase [Desulfococcus multivorans DSM 2059]
MKDKTLSHGLWAATAPPAPVLGPFEGDQHADVAVIGGGYTGLSAALHLAEAGVDTILLEGREIGYGGAGRNVGLVNAGLWLMPDDVLRMLGEEMGERLINVLGASPELVFGLIEQHRIPCEAVHKGTLHCAHSPGGFRALQQRESQWKRRGAPVTLLDREAAAPKIGSNRFYGALLDERAGTVQPLAYVYGLAEAACRAGARLHVQSSVTGLTRDPKGWRLSTPNGFVQARTVILAVQGYPEFAFKAREKELIPFNYFQFATAPLPQDVRNTILPGGEGAWDTHLILSSFRLDQSGRLLLGSVGQVENGGYALHENWARRTIAKLFPQVGSVPLEYAWNGRIAMTVDHIPRFHLLDENLISVTSYNGRGIGPGTVFGKLLAEWALGAPLDAIPLPITSPKAVSGRALRGLFYEAGARLYHLIQRRI